MKEYFSALCAEIREKGKQVSRPVDHIYFGGGTPSLATPYLGMIGEALSESFEITKHVEISLECNPESVSEEFVGAAERIGVNRVSLGVQTLSDPLLKRIGRAHDGAQALAALGLLTKNFSSVNVDVMVGLPGQSQSDVEKTLEKLCDYPIDHISLYSLILEEGTSLYAEAQRGEFLPDEDLSVDLYDFAREMLAQKGFDRYEISNFCKNGSVCGYNTSVWQYGEYLGLGLGSSSFAMTGCREPFGVRTKNEIDLEKYILTNGSTVFEREEVSFASAVAEFVMLGLRLEEGVNTSRFKELFGLNFSSYFSSVLKKDAEFLIITPARVAIRPDRFYVSNSIIGDFFEIL